MTTEIAAIIERGTAAHQEGRIEDALACYRTAVELAPEDAEALSLLGLALIHTGRLGEAEAPLLEAVEKEPEQIGFRLNLVEFLEATQQFDRAMVQIQALMARKADFPRTWEKLGDLSVLQNKNQDAVQAYTRALTFEPGNFPVALKLLSSQLALGHLEDAKQTLGHAARLRPNHDAVPTAHADLLTAQRDWAGLEAASKSWLQLRPDSAAAWRALSKAAYEQGRLLQAMEAYGKVLAHSPKTAESLSVYGRICLNAMEFGAAKTALEEAETIDPEHTETLYAKGMLLTYFGRFDEAETYCRRSIAHDPDFAPAYTLLSQLTRGHLSDEETAAVARLAGQEETPLEYRISASFVLAKGHDARGDIDAAFAAYERANGLSRELNRAEKIAYDPAASIARRERLMTLFPAATEGLADSPGTPRPIFIVGMPRSGTTLLESVLSAHSRVFGCGERPMMQQILGAYLKHADRHENRPPAPDLLREWAAVYSRETPELGGADHITDKFPLNLESVGLIAHLFPKAAIVHVRRNPVETGLSVFRHEFTRFWTFAHRLEDIGHYYGQYARLAAHWERILGERIITVQYETFAADFERAAPRLVQDCGLDWEDACRDFQSSDRPVSTFSTVQARDPVTVRIGRAERYAPHLAPLIEALDTAGVDLETGALRPDI